MGPPHASVAAQGESTSCLAVPRFGDETIDAWIRIAKVQRSKGCICSLRNLQQWEDQSISMKKHDDKPKSRLLLVIAQTVSAFANWRAEGGWSTDIYRWYYMNECRLPMLCWLWFGVFAECDILLCSYCKHKVPTFCLWPAYRKPNLLTSFNHFPNWVFSATNHVSIA